MVYFMTLSFTDQREPNGSIIGEVCTGKTSVRTLESDKVIAVKLNKKKTQGGKGKNRQTSIVRKRRKIFGFAVSGVPVSTSIEMIVLCGKARFALEPKMGRMSRCTYVILINFVHNPFRHILQNSVISDRRN
jgi:hypothetical protein